MDPVDLFVGKELLSRGERLPYRLLSPPAQHPAQGYPLVLFLHGAGERGDDNLAQLRHGVCAFASEEARRRYPCFVVAPQCPAGARWVDAPWDAPAHEQSLRPTDPLRLALTLVSDLQLTFSIDPGRLYVVGLSMGGFGTWDAITRHPRLFAAAVPICGGADLERARATAEVPVWAFHGALDDVVPVQRSRQMVAALRLAGGAPRYTEYPDVGHDAWTRAFNDPELLRWLFAQRRV